MALAQHSCPKLKQNGKPQVNVSPGSSTSNDDVASASPHQSTRHVGEAPTKHHDASSFLRYVWDDPDKPKYEKWFLFKLDVFLLSTACLGCKFIPLLTCIG
jgi:MFS transporter, ACS family, pantothenate transporter